jgi:SAM-dependent methyltransferase
LSTNFKEYAKYYDLFNLEKDYEKECSYIDSIIKRFNPRTKSILDIGCGTGLHDFELANLDYEVTGIDISQEMIEIAKIEAIKRNKSVAFYVDSDQEYIASHKFDAIISLFHVISYQVTDSKLSKLFEVANNNLKSGGLFIFDYWYTPAVEFLKLEKREKVVNFEGKSYTKSSEPKTEAPGIHKINITISSNEFSFSEEHLMKSFVPDYFSKLTDFKILENYAWMTTSAPSHTNWSAITILQKL